MSTETITQIAREAPDIEARKLGLIDSAKALAEQPLTLPEYTLAGFQDPETQAFNLAKQGIGSYAPFLQQAQQAAIQAMDKLSGIGGAPTQAQLDAYMNPFQQSVIDATMSELDKQGALARSQLAGQATLGGTFGGSRYGVQEAELAGNLQDARARALAQLNLQNFTQAQTGIQNQLERERLAALGISSLAPQFASFGAQEQAQRGQDISQLLGIGGLQRGQSQAELDIARQNVLQNIYEPYQRLGFYGDVLAGAPTSQQTLVPAVSPGVSPLQQAIGVGIGSLAGIAGLRKSGVV